jgi:flagellar motor switch protein FliN/FliY
MIGRDEPEFTPHNTGAGGGGEAVPANLETFASGFFEGAASALTTVLNRKVTIHPLGVRSTTAAELLATTPLPWLLIEVTYQRGLTGTHWLLLPVASVLSLGGLLIGDREGEEGEISAAHREAIRDAANQMLAAAGPSLMPLFARSVSFAPARVKLVEGGDALPPELGPADQGVWIIRAQGKSADGAFVADLVLTVGADLARQIAALGAQEAAGTPEAEPSRAGAAPSKLDLILDVMLPVTVELGRARMQIQDILKLAPGAVIELDRSAGDPVDLYIKDRPIAKGEVVVIDENFGVRITSIVATTERIKTFR